MLAKYWPTFLVALLLGSLFVLYLGWLVGPELPRSAAPGVVPPAALFVGVQDRVLSSLTDLPMSPDDPPLPYGWRHTWHLVDGPTAQIDADLMAGDDTLVIVHVSNPVSFSNPTGHAIDGQFLYVQVWSTQPFPLTWESMFRGTAAYPLPVATVPHLQRFHFAYSQGQWLLLRTWLVL